MWLADSTLDPLAMARARRLLATPVRRERAWPALAAAGFAAAGAMVLATATIFLPLSVGPDVEQAGR